jgi:uncharacterized protein (DUF58 family)
MRLLSATIAIVSLVGVIVMAPIYGAAIFMLLLFGLFLLALVGVLSGVDDRSVPQHDPAMNPKAWRNGDSH